MTTPEARIEQIIDRGRAPNATSHSRFLAYNMLNNDHWRAHMLELFRRRGIR